MEGEEGGWSLPLPRPAPHRPPRGRGHLLAHVRSGRRTQCGLDVQHGVAPAAGQAVPAAVPQLSAAGQRHAGQQGGEGEPQPQQSHVHGPRVVQAEVEVVAVVVVVEHGGGGLWPLQHQPQHTQHRHVPGGRRLLFQSALIPHQLLTVLILGLQLMLVLILGLQLVLVLILGLEGLLALGHQIMSVLVLGGQVVSTLVLGGQIMSALVLK